MDNLRGPARYPRRDLFASQQNVCRVSIDLKRESKYRETVATGHNREPKSRCDMATDSGLFDSRDVAAYIAQQCRENGYSYNNTKIQKLLYAAYGTLLAWKGRRICDEYPRAWAYGPVFPKVFQWIHKGNGDIAKYSTVVGDQADEDLQTAVVKVVAVYGRHTASTLSSWSHMDGSPWWRVIKDEQAGWNSFMPDEYVATYFKENILGR